LSAITLRRLRSLELKVPPTGEMVRGYTEVFAIGA
jgi:hypothetical protein